MTISQKTIKLLWANSAGRCSFDGCNKRLCLEDAHEFAPYTIGQMAHICGRRPGSNRYVPSSTPDFLDSYANLILLCPDHHAIIDKKENENCYSVEKLNEMKKKHELTVKNALENEKNNERNAAVYEIHRLLSENREVWIQYGPTSKLARENPHNESAHAVWKSERLSTIVPNNRKICEILASNRYQFEPNYSGIIKRFQLHARSYEWWVNDEIFYHGVTKFPVDFEKMIDEIVNASI